MSEYGTAERFVFADHPAVFAAVDAPPRASVVCEAMDAEIAPHNVNNVRPRCKRLAERGILIETDRGCSPDRGHGRPASRRPGRSP
ncbi:hypothetical protein [Streptomyces fagopyri]|uniref:hypothetical protein n=1 Tax=Streptomyces fagopyri TaxID=2662397 RepID=UPI00371B880E